MPSSITNVSTQSDFTDRKWAKITSWVATVLVATGLGTYGLFESIESASDANERSSLHWIFDTYMHHEGSQGGAECMPTAGVLTNNGRLAMTIESFSLDKNGSSSIPFFSLPDTQIGMNLKETINRSQPLTLEPGHTAIILLIPSGNESTFSAYATLADGTVHRFNVPKVAYVDKQRSILRSTGSTPPPLIESLRTGMLLKAGCSNKFINIDTQSSSQGS